MAAYLEWKDSYAVGVEEFDQDHQHLIGLANQAITAAEAGTKFADVRDLLENLIEEAVVHFENEERIMREVDFPGLAEHQEAHDLLIRTFIKYKSELKFKTLEASEVAGFMIDWLVVHIKTFDMSYGTYLHNHGIK